MRGTFIQNNGSITTAATATPMTDSTPIDSTVTEAMVEAGRDVVQQMALENQMSGVIKLEDQLRRIYLAMRSASADNSTVTEAIARATLPQGHQYIDEEALDRWRSTEGKNGHDLSANNNTVWRLVATIDRLRTLLAMRSASLPSGWQPIETAPLGVHGHVWAEQIADRTDATGTVHEYPGGERFVSSSFRGYNFTHWHSFPEPPKGEAL